LFSVMNGEIMSEKRDITQHLKNQGQLSRFFCHQMPERTFKINGTYFPVCSRCTGFYIGAFSYFIYVYFYYVDYNLMTLISSFLLLIPSFIDGITQFFNLRESNNILRFFTGLLGGVGLAILIKAFKLFIFLNSIF
jgi:uncharacterized membrane protein